MERLRREQNAGLFNVDVLYNNESLLLLNEFLPGGRMVNFVLDSVHDLVAPEAQTLLLTQRWSSRVLIYNSKLHPDGPPIDTLWDLTCPEMKS